MAGFFLRGALIEYGSDVLGPLPNIVVFQFNPEQIARTITMPNPTGSNPETAAREREAGQSSAPPLESFEITAHFSAADDLGKGGAISAIPRAFGIGPQLAALEKMAVPSTGLLSQLIGAAVDAIGDALGKESDSQATRATPREKVPRLLFFWGPSRVVPVKIRSLAITEQKYDPLLNPVQAEVRIGLEIPNSVSQQDDIVGNGALTYTATIKEAQAAANLVKAVELAIDVIPF
ncbi:MAG: hypothetical protein KDI83_17920 [Gammaproteobacteria bacterium]|nr:hypothetical protein [Gammaproteobacteria bacterium]